MHPVLEIWTGMRQRLLSRRFWRNSGLLILANMIALGLGLVRTPAMAWLLPKDEVGMINVVMAWLPFLQLLSLPGLDLASYHYMAKGQPAAFAANLSYRLRWSLLSTLGFLGGAAYWRWKGSMPLAWLFLVAGLSYPATTGLTACAGALSAQEAYVSLFWYRLGESLARFAGFAPLLLSVWLLAKGVTFYAVNQVALAALQIGVSIRLVRRFLTASAPMPPAETREMVRYGRHLTVMSGIDTLRSQADVLLVSAFLPLSTVADYAIASIVYNELKQLWIIYVTLRYPPLVRMEVPRRRRRLLLEGGLVWLGFGVAGIALGLLANWVVPLVLPESYAGSLAYVPWLLAAFVASIPGFLAEVFFRTEQDERSQYILRVLSAASSIALPAALIASSSAQGVVVGRLLSSVVLSVAGSWLFWRSRGNRAG
jgi:O-antigen/teichoic acid export membrane protein